MHKGLAFWPDPTSSGEGRTARLSSSGVIREGTLDDAAAVAELLSLVTPEFLSTEASVRHMWSTDSPASRRRWWCVDEDATLVGWASVGLVVETSEEGVGWVSVNVHPEHRGRGIGSALLDVALAHATVIDARKLHAWSRSDDATVRFALAHGFTQTNSSDLLVLDPRTVSAPEPPPGVELRPFSAFEADPSPIHHVDELSMIDEPGEITFDDVPYDYWLAHFWANPLLDRDASTVALVDGIAATVTFLTVDRARGRATNNGTGTLPEYRGRGLAMLAKRASLARAAELGVTAVYTGNDVTNAPMQAINRKLGYAPCSSMLSWSKTLTT